MKRDPQSSCPCVSGKTFQNCCLPLLSGDQVASTAEALMRSRYSAFVVNDMDYIFKTTDPQARAEFDVEANREWSETCEFQNLEVLKAEENGPKAFIEFKATYKTADGKVHIHHEYSKFRKQGGIWYFRDAKVYGESNASE